MPADLPAPTASVETITAGLAAVDYIASRPIATALLLARDLGTPVLVEGSVSYTHLTLPTNSRV